RSPGDRPDLARVNLRTAKALGATSSGSFVRRALRGRAEADSIDLAGQPVKIDVQAVHAHDGKERPEMHANLRPRDRGFVSLIDENPGDAEPDQRLPEPETHARPHVHHGFKMLANPGGQSKRGLTPGARSLACRADRKI